MLVPTALKTNVNLSGGAQNALFESDQKSVSSLNPLSFWTGLFDDFLNFIEVRVIWNNGHQFFNQSVV